MDAKMTAEPQSTFYTLSWEGLNFEWQGGADVITLSSHNIETCKLQHVLSADVANRLFMANLDDWIELRVESPGHVRIIDSGSHVKDTEQPWPVVIPQIERALQNTTSISLAFDSLSELESTISIMSDRHKQVMSSKDVGVYIENQTDKAMLVKFVGAEQTVELLIENVKQAQKTYVQRKTQMMSLSSSLKDIKTYCERQRYSVEIVEYIEATNFEQKFNEHYPDLKLTGNKDDHAVLELYGPSVERIKQGFSFIDVYVKDSKQLKLKLEDDVFSFVKNENVTVFLKLRLKEVSAYFVIGKCVTVWAADDKTLNKAKECFSKSIRWFDVEGWWSPAARNIIRSNHKKIVCTFFGDTKKRILFTNDKCNEADQLAKVISESEHVDKTYTQWQWKVRAFVEFGALSKLQSCHGDVDIQVLEKRFTVRLQTISKSFLDIASKEVDIYMSCIRKLETCSTDENGISDLIKRKCVQEYLKTEHKIEGIIPLDDGNGSSCFVYLARTSKDPPLKDIFGSKLVDKKKLEENAGKMFLKKHKDMIYMKENPKSVYLCMTRNIWSEFVTPKHETRKQLNHAAFRFLREFGSDLLKTLESRYSLCLTMEDDCVVCLGDKTFAQQCLEELERKIAVSVIHLTDEENGREIDLSKVIVDEIENKQAVGINTLVACETCIASNEVKGKQYFAKWCFGNDNGRVAVAEVDFTISDAFIDVVVIPVNSCLYGRDIFHDRKADVSYGKYFDKPSEKQQVGFFKRWACEKGLASKHCVALVTDDVVMTSTVTLKSQGRMSIGKDQLTKSFSDIFGQIFDSGFSKICVAVSQDNNVITRNVETIVQTFQERLGKCKKQIKDVELVFCLRRNPEEIIQNLDRSVKSIAMTRRELSPSVQGMFVQPKVKTTILQESLVKVTADCYALAVSHDVNLGRGPVAIAVSEAAGKDLQECINTNLKSHLKDGDTVVFEPFELKRQGVRKLIFGNLPIWKDRHNLTVIERFVEDCLLRADSLGCSSVAFPALGTGNLKYPPRDVAGAMLDGIAKYAAETTTGNLTEVSICVPKIKDDLMYQILAVEKAKREDMSSTAKQTSDDVPFLDACYGKVRYRVVKNRHWNLFSSGRSVKVEFNSVSGSPDDTFFVSSHWKIGVSTGTSKDSLRKAVRNVINKCENDKITSIIIIMNEAGFQFSGSDQIDVIMETALNELAKRNQKEPYYLDDVIVAIEDSTFDLFAELKLVDNQRSKSWRGKSLAWEKFFHRRNKVSTNVVIAGDEREKVLLAKKEIRAIIKPREVRITTAEEVNAVSAQINPGIIMYLKSLQNDYYNRWREQVQQVYTIKIDEDAGQNIVTISGAFENILKIEAYLEKDFPSLPNAKPFRKHNKIIEVEERHFEAKENSDQQKKVRKEKEPSVCIDHFEFATHKLKVVIQRSDITRVKTEYIVSEIQAKISNHIADQAGKQFKGELKARLEQERGWPVTRCFCTGHGDLKVKQVIHVYCPQNCEEKTTDKLIELSSSMLSCLKMADDLQGESIAIPLLCAETWPFGICINEYFRALIDFNETKTLKQALLVDSDAEKVKLAIEGLAKCVENCSDRIIQAASSLSIISSDKCVKLDVASGNLCVSSVDAIVIVEDTSFSHPNESSKQIHDLAGHQYQQKYEECSRQEHKISEVICIEGAAVIGVKGVLIAFPPPWIKQNNLFSTQICKTVDNVFQQIATMKHVRSVSLPCFYSGDETEVKRLCCGLMIKQIIRCLADIPTALKEIHLIFPNPQGVSIMLQEIIKIIQKKVEK